MVWALALNHSLWQRAYTWNISSLSIMAFLFITLINFSWQQPRVRVVYSRCLQLMKLMINVNWYQSITINWLISIIDGQSMGWKFVIIGCFNIYWLRIIDQYQWHRFGHRFSLIDILIDIFGQLISLESLDLWLSIGHRLPKINRLIVIDWNRWSIAN